jgi:menaquinone-9 beta-reductase
MYDLIVVGAGPGGSAAAIRAARSGAQVLLLERGQFPRHKVCGEFVSAESLELLRTLLPGDSALISAAPNVASARIFSDGAVLSAEIDPPAASIPRYELDSALWQSCAAAGVEVLANCSVKSIEGAGPFRVRTADADFECKSVTNAAGRWSALTSARVRSLAPKTPWVGIKAHFVEADSPRSVDLYFIPGGYCGVQPVTMPAASSEAVVNACAMVRADVAVDLRTMFTLNPELRARSSTWRQVIETVRTSPLIFHDPEPLQNQVLQVGDAATFVDPFIGDGISLALRSGALAAECLLPLFREENSLGAAASEYSARYMRDLAPVFRASSRLRNLLQWPALVRRPVLSILQHTPAITRQLVRMTR